MGRIVLQPEDEARAEALAGNLFAACLATMELANVELGVRLGLYEALAGAGFTTPAELALSTGIAERYAREWLEQQAVAGVLEVEAVAEGADGVAQAEAVGQAEPVGQKRRFKLPNAHAHVLIDDDSEACMKPCSAVVPWVGKALDIMVEEFRTGRGAAFGLFDLHDLQAAFTRPVFANHLTQHWLPALPEVQAKLAAGEPVRIAELGCGEGLAAVTIAAAYPNATVDGYDLDAASIAVARAHALSAGVADRVHFGVRDVASSTPVDDYDLVMAIEMLHDVPDPVGVLRSMKQLAGSNGTALVVDERTADAFGVPATDMERFFYTFSTLHCLAVSMQDGGAGTGTVMRADTLRRYANEAGFARVDVLDVDHPQFRLYRLS